MRVVVALLIVALALCAFAEQHGGSGSICDRYSAALGVSNADLLGTVVDGTIAIVAGPGPTKKYFDGTKPPGSTNYLTNAAALSALRTSLINFFWRPLGCTDRPIRNYTGGAMGPVHAAMGISDTEFTFFENALLNVLIRAGVSPADVTTVKGVLETTRAAIVTKSASICDKYSAALQVSNNALLSSLVSSIIANLIAPGTPTLKYFDGTKPQGSVNFTAPVNAPSLKALKQSLIAFFWAPLGCSDKPAPVYMGSTMRAVHKNMGINSREFQFFVSAAGSALTAAGVSNDDLTTVANLLTSFQTQIVTS